MIPFICATFHTKKSYKKGKIVKVSTGGGSRPCVKMYLPYAKLDDIVQKIIYRTGNFFECKLLNKVNKNYIKPGMTVLDCGANVGNHSLYFARISKAEKVYAFEAAEDTYNILKKNISLNKLDDVIIAKKVALGEKDSRANIKFTRSKTNTGYNKVEESSDGVVEMRPLDELVQEKVDFIKIDVEGYELEVLKGAHRILKEQHPIIWIEIWKDNYEAISKYILSYGYKITLIDNKENYICTY